MTLDSRTYRNIWGTFATGVTVITTATDGWLHGMTANGVTSVSLDPLLMLVCVDKNARCHRQMVEARRFGMSLLAADQEDLSNLFARGADPEKDSLRGAAYSLGDHGTPILDGCLGYIECDLREIVPGGDHDIFIGEAHNGEILRPEDSPLLFFRGGYRQLS